MDRSDNSHVETKIEPNNDISNVETESIIDPQVEATRHEEALKIKLEADDSFKKGDFSKVL